jgi:dipeptidyl aminopeptidase/acylaminoacyl peptidase
MDSVDLAAQSAVKYQTPPAAIESLLTAPATPLVRVSPDRTMMTVEQPQALATIADVAQPRYRLAGIRFNPATNGPSRELYSTSLAIQATTGGAARTVTGLPAAAKILDVSWSPDGKHVAFVEKTTGTGAGLTLYVVDVATAHARQLSPVRLNAVMGVPYQWMPDSSALLCLIVPERGAVPAVSEVPEGPNVEENLGKVTPARTYEDLLKTPGDERIFEYYATSQLAIVPLNGPVHKLPVKGVLSEATPSPDGKFALVSEVHRPFSYTLPAEMFPLKTSVVTLKTGAAKSIFDRPLVDSLPIAFDAVPVGPRDFGWRSDVPATLTWIEANDGGDPAKKVDVRDRLMALSAPFDSAATAMLEAPMRLRGIDWGNEHLGIATEARWSDRKIALLAFDPATGKATTLYEGSSQDRYNSPGRPVTVPNAMGQSVLKLTADGSAVYFIGPGASPGGDKPFVAEMPLHGGALKRLWHSEDPYYAQPVAILGGDKVLVRRESQTEPPNFFVASLTEASASMTQVTQFASPYAGLKLPTKQLVKYKRADGVDLTATLWLPAGYDKSQGPLPTLMEAYPAEFKTRAAAGQTSGSPNRFPRITWGSPVFFTATGYAVLENAAIPIIGEGNAQPNDSYVEQLVAGAKAAVDYGASLGVVDPKRVAVMGHSYGAFMTANLLAHSDMFRAGIARSGAYNRTLTPYGFQAEERTYWQAPDVYYKMSPFSYADKIKTPLLMIHGEADDNQGTFPIQSERFYAALKGQGATVRLVWLPLEAHGYEAHESLSHMLWEMERWLDTYVKPAEPVKTSATKDGAE